MHMQRVMTVRESLVALHKTKRWLQHIRIGIGIGGIGIGNGIGIGIGISSNG